MSYVTDAIEKMMNGGVQVTDEDPKAFVARVRANSSYTSLRTVSHFVGYVFYAFAAISFCLAVFLILVVPLTALQNMAPSPAPDWAALAGLCIVVFASVSWGVVMIIIGKGASQSMTVQCDMADMMAEVHRNKAARRGE